MNDLKKTGGGAKVPGKESLRPLPARRFYKTASCEARGKGFLVLLDGKGIKTPKKRDLLLPSRGFAQAVADEWAAQGECIDPASMILTRIANSALDGVADKMDAVAADIAAFAASDLLCYRATAPEALVTRQRVRWDPVITWARDELGADLAVTSGVVHVVQPQGALKSIRTAVAGLGAFQLASLHVMTTLTGSALLALAVARHRLTSEEAWAAAHVDEDWQIEQWGRDAEAEARRALRLAEFRAATRALELATE